MSILQSTTLTGLDKHGAGALALAAKAHRPTTVERPWKEPHGGNQEALNLERIANTRTCNSHPTHAWCASTVQYGIPGSESNTMGETRAKWQVRDAAPGPAWFIAVLIARKSRIFLSKVLQRQWAES